jgi:hypothetical protein
MRAFENLLVDAMLKQPKRPSRIHIERKDIRRGSKHFDATPDHATSWVRWKKELKS